MRKVATPMIIMVATSVFLRPTRSPMCPKISPPTGRATNPAAKVAKVAKASSVPTAGSAPGKKSLGNTRPAAVPYKKKSYHSTLVPTRLETTTVRSSDLETCGASVTVSVPLIATPGRCSSVRLG